jgi:nucleoside-diphosphate-sugar epimerase
MVAKNLIESIELQDYEIIGVTPNPDSEDKSNFRVITPADLLSKKFANFDFILNFARGYNSLDSKSGVINVLKRFHDETKWIINTSSYAQHYNIASNSDLSTYLDSKRKVSSLLNSEHFKSKIFDLSFFTLFGDYDKASSLMSKLIPSLIKNEEIFLTECEQLISYTDVGDVASLLKDLMESPESFTPGAYSFWPTPPVKLRVIIDDLYRITESSSLINYGAKSYSGHELFEYSAGIFPPQITPNYKWKSYNSSLECLVSMYNQLL